MISKPTALLVGCLLLIGGSLFAGNFASLTNFTVGDVLLCFRQDTGTNDLVVDAGPVATFTNLPGQTRLTLTNFNAVQLSLVGTNSVTWSAFAWFNTTAPAGLPYTLFLTRPRSSANKQTTPWNLLSPTDAQAPADDMATLPPGATDALKAAYNTNSNPLAVLEPDDSLSPTANPIYQHGSSYGYVIGPDGDFNGDFPQGSIENTTPAAFTPGGMISRSDFYQLTPPGADSPTNTSPGLYLGYFELATNATLTFVAVGSLTTPVIQSIGRTNTVTSVSFTTGGSGTYTLRGTNSTGLNAPRLTWPALASVPGDGDVHTLTDTNSGSNQFYLITAQ